MLARLLTSLFPAILVLTTSLLAACAQDQTDTSPGAGPAAAGYSQDTPIEILAADPAAKAVLNKDLPGLLTDAQYPLFKRMSLKSIQQASGGDLSAEDVSKTVSDLKALPVH